MLVGKASVRHSRQRLSDLVLGSWSRTLAIAALILVVASVFVWAADTGRIAALGQLSWPGHPYPPAGFYRNPFAPSPALVNAADAARVKADLLQDGQAELEAVATGNASLLTIADTGNRLSKGQASIETYNDQGIFAKQQTSLSSIRVGLLPDPNDPAVLWCVEEQGTATITYFSKASGNVLRQESFRFDDRFWMRRTQNRFLITDAEINNRGTE